MQTTSTCASSVKTIRTSSRLSTGACLGLKVEMEAHTPCHYDTYGCNLVAQLSGEKRWVLFSPGDTESLYPTRVPYEESSVFSRVNVIDPDLKTFTKFANATSYSVSVHIHIC